MGLQRDIVIVNEFSQPGPGGRGGSRGSTPGGYVLRYMARKGATEDMAPVRRDDATEGYVLRYMLRRDAVEGLDDPTGVDARIEASEGLGGRAFGRVPGAADVELSLSDAGVRDLSARIQEAFDDGRTVMKTVISFHPDYLARCGVTPPGFVASAPGDYRGRIDQMKLRRAVSRGVDRISSAYDDLAWVGSVQVDTEHVHVHLAMVDVGTGRRRADGRQVGMLSARSMSLMRRGIDAALDEMSPIASLAAETTRDRTNARAFVRRITHELIESRGAPQMLLAVLPRDRRMWRAASRARPMRRANLIATGYVEDLLAEPDSGYDEAMRRVASYADARARREGLSAPAHRRLIDRGRERLIRDCVNAVYRVLAETPAEEASVRTPMIDVMACDVSALESRPDHPSDPLVEFGLHLRSYSSRLSHHAAERRRYRDAISAFRESEESGAVSEAARALLDCYRVELDYNDGLVAKYRALLPFAPIDVDEGAFAELVAERERLSRMREMADDPELREMDAEAAERLGERRYGLPGGGIAAEAPRVMGDRVSRVEREVSERFEDLSFSLAESGMILSEDETGALSIRRGSRWSFDDVRGFDLHHLDCDFSSDVRVSESVVASFSAAASARSTALSRALAYLRESGQERFARALPEDDVRAMEARARELASDPVIRRDAAVSAGVVAAAPTIPIDSSRVDDIRDAVSASIARIDPAAVLADPSDPERDDVDRPI